MSARTYLSLLARNVPVRRLWIAGFASHTGDALSTVALWVVARDLSGATSPVAVLMGLSWFAPSLLSPIAGLAADRLSRRKIMVAADLARVGTLALLVLAYRAHSLAFLLGAAGLHFSLAGFFKPAESAYLQTLATGKDLVDANSILMLARIVGFTLGAALSAFLTSWLGPIVVLCCDAASFVISAGFIVRIPAVTTDGAHEATPSTDAAHVIHDKSWAPVLAALKRSRPLRAVLLVKSFYAVTFQAFWVLVIYYAQRVFPLGVQGAVTVGTVEVTNSVLAVLVLMRLDGVFREVQLEGKIRTIQRLFAYRVPIMALYVVAAVVAGRGLGGYAACVVLSLLGASLVSLTGAPLLVGSTLILRELSEDQNRGRIFSLELAGFHFFGGVAALAMGLAIDCLGDHPVIFSAIPMALSALVAAYYTTLVRRLDVGDWASATPDPDVRDERAAAPVRTS